jgi:hypothetical protein
MSGRALFKSQDGMCDPIHCERLLRIIAEHEDAMGRAPVRTVQKLYGDGFDDAWSYARNRFYLQSGGETHLLKLSHVGRLAID